MKFIESKLLRLPFDAILTNNLTKNVALQENVMKQKIFIQTMSLVTPSSEIVSKKKKEKPMHLLFMNGKKILFAGRLELVKGLHVLIRAFTQLPDEFKLIVLGTGSREGELIALSRSLGVQNRVFFLGQVPYSEVASYIVSVDVVACPSLSELQGSRTMWDAFLLKIPVVTTEVGDIPKYVENSTHAVVVPPNDAESFARGIIRIFKEPIRTKQMIEDAYDLANKATSRVGPSGFIKASNYVMRKRKTNRHHII
jgi:glycosyltransferase involved in cell wall biosynthesis